MDRRPGNGLHRLVLLLYCIYAMSPIYLLSMGGRADLSMIAQQPGPKVTVGIVWVNVVLTSLAETGRDAAGSAAAVASADEARDFVLIKKKRAIFTETYRIRPLTAVQVEPDPPGAAVPSSCTAALPPAGHVLRSQTPLSSHLGLSPPRLS